MIQLDDFFGQPIYGNWDLAGKIAEPAVH